MLPNGFHRPSQPCNHNGAKYPRQIYRASLMGLHSKFKRDEILLKDSNFQKSLVSKIGFLTLGERSACVSFWLGPGG